MTARAALSFAPRLMGAAEAAAYLGVSQTKLVEANIPRRTWGGRRLYDKIDLDRFASDLPYEGDEPGEVQSCDRLFGARA